MVILGLPLTSPEYGYLSAANLISFEMARKFDCPTLSASSNNMIC